MATPPTPESRAEFESGVLQFVQYGGDRAANTLRGRSFKKLELLCRRHFEGASPQHIFGPTDWRVVQETFTFIWKHASEDGRNHWATLGEDLYRMMEYLHDSPVPTRAEASPQASLALCTD